MHIDFWILTFSLITVALTVGMGFWSAKKAKTASDFFVAGRSVSVGWNASAISGEYLSAASFMGIAGMVMKNGYDALWYPVCYACGYLFLLLFIAGPLRRFGAYTIPDFAEGRYDSPVFRKIAVIFVLFIGFFYTMPQMKGAGTTLAYIFPGLDYRWGVLLVGAVITLNVSLGGMKGITLVQAFQYWLKMFAISVPVFVLMAVYGGYGHQVQINTPTAKPSSSVSTRQADFSEKLNSAKIYKSQTPAPKQSLLLAKQIGIGRAIENVVGMELRDCSSLGTGEQRIVFGSLAHFTGWELVVPESWPPFPIVMPVSTGAAPPTAIPRRSAVHAILDALEKSGAVITPLDDGRLLVTTSSARDAYLRAAAQLGWINYVRKGLPKAAPDDKSWLMPFGPLTTKAAKAANAIPRWNLSDENRATVVDEFGAPPPTFLQDVLRQISDKVEKMVKHSAGKQARHSDFEDWTNMAPNISMTMQSVPMLDLLENYGLLAGREVLVTTNLPRPRMTLSGAFHSTREFTNYIESVLLSNGVRLQWEQTAMKAVAITDWDAFQKKHQSIVFVPNKMFSFYFSNTLDFFIRFAYGEAAGKKIYLSRDLPKPGVMFNPGFDVMLVQEALPQMEKVIADDGVTLIPAGRDEVWAVPTAGIARYQLPQVNQRALSLLYTYSLIIALVCGTAGLPHILVRFYTNPDGVAAKRTTMWVMILIGVFYVFPPVFGVLGRNLLPELYSAVGAKGTDKAVLELPSLLNQKYPGLGSVLSGITCAGAFAAFMSTFSGLLVSMTGALAHDVYGRILKPQASPEQRLRAFKICAVIIGVVAILLGMQVEKLDINFMVGQAFAIAAASYFPLLFLSVWWRGMTMRGAACGMLGGGLLALAGISLTSFSDLKLIHLDAFWAAHPLARILCEQPAIWAVPLAIGLMILVSKLTRAQTPPDVRMKMLVLHAPEKLGLKQEYIQEHAGH